MIDTPGIYTISAEEYHADPCPAPSLSSSIARELLAASPEHARFAHPRLNPDLEREDKDAFDLGTAAHAYLLEGEAGFAIIDAPDWRKKDAQEARAAARLAGKVPLLAHRWEDVKAMAAAARRRLAAHEDPPVPLTAGKPEQTLIWQEKNGVWCRARLDWLHDTLRVIDDYKTTERAAGANPDTFGRALFGMGYDVQAAFYLRGLRAVAGIDATFRFVVQESFKPFAVSVVALAPDVATLAEKKVLYAIHRWGECSRASRWPGYPTRTCWIDLPPWEEQRWLQKEMIDDGRPLADQMMGDAAR